MTIARDRAFIEEGLRGAEPRVPPVPSPAPEPRRPAPRPGHAGRLPTEQRVTELEVWLAGPHAAGQGVLAGMTVGAVAAVHRGPGVIPEFASRLERVERRLAAPSVPSFPRSFPRGPF